VARRRDVRRFGRGPYLLALDAPVTLRAGDNGSGLGLLGIVVRAAREGAQFVVATHSPVLPACPEARICELDDGGLAPCAYDDLEAVRFTRGFLDAPDRYIRAALEQ
jgi:hypothetical protein